MLTLAEITQMRVDTNLCEVRVPLLEPAGSKKHTKMWATMTLPPGVHGGYAVGDVVFVAFADNSFNRPVVLGQLYRGNAVSGSGSYIDDIGNARDQLDIATAFDCVRLTAVGDVQLPNTTAFKASDGTVLSGNSVTFQNLLDRVVNLETLTSTLLTNIQTLQASIESLTNSVNALDIKVRTLQLGSTTP
jgi:hypothetical protein